jgi:hypothetical protein
MEKMERRGVKFVDLDCKIVRKNHVRKTLILHVCDL